MKKDHKYLFGVCCNFEQFLSNYIYIHTHSTLHCVYPSLETTNLDYCIIDGQWLSLQKHNISVFLKYTMFISIVLLLMSQPLADCSKEYIYKNQ